INTMEPRHQIEFFKAYEKVFSSRKEVKTFDSRFIENGWISVAWKKGELMGVRAQRLEVKLAANPAQV
ncbi:MAG: hypothetical protein JSV29_00005, partial [Candidatus Bathyarchaeota archaeon]